MVNVGILGLGPTWETRYRPALQKLRSRIAIRAVYDLVANRAEQVAAEWNATAMGGAVALSERSDLAAFLMLGTGWHRWESLRLLCAKKKPVYIAGDLGTELETLHRLHNSAFAAGQTLMPELGLRYTPATSRLRELLATRLGNAHRIVIDAVTSGPADSTAVSVAEAETQFLIKLFDWCGYITQTLPVRLWARPLETPNESARQFRSITIEFHPRNSGPVYPRVEVRLSRRPDRDVASLAQGQTAVGLGELHQEIFCERGRAVIPAATEISWSAGGELTSESLSSERSEVEVMLDHFCRRVVGGLIPVADLSDVSRCAALVQAARQSLKSDCAVLVNGSV